MNTMVLPKARGAGAAATHGWLAETLLAQRGHLLLWVPICLSFGIGGWFALRVEPGAGFYWACGLGALALLLAGLFSGETHAPLFRALALVLCGALLAGARAHSVSAPVLGFRYYGPIEGRIVAIDRSASDKPRLTLDRVVLEDMRPERVPEHVRVSLHGEQGHVTPEPGLTVILTGHLSPPNGPVEPGGFDFRRLAWFDGLGAVGYTRTPVLALASPEDGQAGLAVFRIRRAISGLMQTRIPGPAGAFAAAILTGDRSGMPRGAVEDLRGSNMAHLLAISGLHMGLLTGVVYGALRTVLALIPWLALRYPIRKFAAIGALVTAAGYLALSGGAVSTQRAFVMVAVMLVGVLLERRAVSLRSVAIAATILLVIRPEALFGPGFQMSFAATTALVVVFGLVRDHRDRLWRAPRWLSPVLAVLISSAVAGAATAPFSAAHFNRIADYGLLANLLSVPVMGTVVMPAAVAAAVLWPIGLSGLALTAMRLGLEWILLVANTVAGLDGAVRHVMMPGPSVLPCLTFGALWLVVCRGPVRWLGVVGILSAAALWAVAERPAILIADTGSLIGVMGPEGRVLSKPKGDGFSAGSWLENDGDPVDQATAATRPGLSVDGGGRQISLDGLSVRHLTGRAVTQDLGVRCGPGIIVINKTPDTMPAGPCRVLDPIALRKTGAVAIWQTPDGPRVVTAADLSGRRLWSH